MKNKNLIAVHGSYFGDNFGDRLFVEIFADWISQIDGISNDNIALPFANQRIRSTIPCSDIKGVKALLLSKCIIFIGGGYFGEFKAKDIVWNIRLIIRHLLIGIYAILANKPFIIIGIGAGPLSNLISRKLVTFVCNHADKVIVRDIESQNYLSEYGVKPEKIKLSVDTVLGIENVKKDFKKTNKPKIALHFPYPYPSDDINRIIQDVKIFCDKLDDFEIYHFRDFHKLDFDDFTEKEILRTFDNTKVSKIIYENPKQLINEIGQFDIIITAKLHVGIVALTQDVYTASVAIHQKTQRLYRQLGLEEFTTPLINYEQGRIISILEGWAIKKQVIPIEIIRMANENRIDLNNFIKKHFSLN